MMVMMMITSLFNLCYTSTDYSMFCVGHFRVLKVLSGGILLLCTVISFNITEWKQRTAKKETKSQKLLFCICLEYSVIRM